MFKKGNGTLVKVLSAVLYLSFLCLPRAASSQETFSPETDMTEGIISNGVCFSETSSHLNMLTGESHGWGSGEVLQFGACSDQFAIGIALNEALSGAGTGISLDKIHYRWEWINGCFNVTKSDGSKIYCDSDIENRLDENFKPTGEYADQFDELRVVVTITDSNNNVIKEKIYDYDTWFHWNRQNEHSTNETTQESENDAVWQITEDDIELFNHLTGTGTIYSPSHLGNVSFVVTSVDNGKWDGYYGPVVRGGDTTFTYRSNPCNLDALYHPTCEGYAKAYAKYLYDQACLASSLYDTGCPGYDAAYLTQQCNIDALYNQQCPLYQVAYHNQQCEIDGQYDISCPNYVAPNTENNVVAAPESVEEIIADTNITSQPIAELNITLVPDIPIIAPTVIIPQTIVIDEIPTIDQVSTESLEAEIAQIEAQIQTEETNDGRTEKQTPSAIEPDSSEGRDTSTKTENSSGSEPEQESQEKPAEPEKNDGSGSDTDGKSEESSDDESSESKSDDGEEKDTGEDTGSEDDNGKDKEVDESKDADETIESEEDATRPEKKEEKSKLTEKEKKDSRTKKIKALVAAKIEAITRDMDNADTIEEQMVIQAQLLALIAFVPDFDYGEMEVPDIYFYPPKPTVDHAFSRWFVNDPTFGVMEDLQYPNLR